MTDISQSNWSETDNTNNQPAPDGAPEGMAPSGVNNTMRAMMGGMKRFWGRINGTIKTTNIGDAYTYTPPTVAPSLIDGEIYTFRCNAANTGPSTLNVGVGGAQAVVKSDGIAGSAALDANDLLPGIYYQAAWDSLSSHFVVLNTGVGAAVGSLSADVNAAIRSTSAAIKTDIASVSAAIKTDIGSVSAAITSAFGASDRSTSVVIKSDLGSVSTVIATALHSVSLVINTDLHSISAVLKTAINAVIPTGSVVLFAQAAAPAGWTKVVTWNDRLLRVVSGATGGTTGGAWAISGLSNESANHTHTYSGTTAQTADNLGMNGGGVQMARDFHTHAFSGTTAGVSANHTHTGDGTWRPAYLDIIPCSKN